MIEMTAAARERLDNYLQRMRSELRGTRGGFADEVEQSVREHIEIALAGAHAPVGATEVIGVLDRLGAPERWLADEERPMWRRALDHVRSSPDDWRDNLVDPDHDPTKRSGSVLPPDMIEDSLHHTAGILVPVNISLGFPQNAPALLDGDQDALSHGCPCGLDLRFG